LNDTTSTASTKPNFSEAVLAKHWDAIQAIREALTRTNIREEAAIQMTSGTVALGYSGGPG